jgi:hypothetical protein
MAERQIPIVLLSNQLRRNALHVYGNPDTATPHIDRLAGAAVHSTQVCST